MKTENDQLPAILLTETSTALLAVIAGARPARRPPLRRILYCQHPQPEHAQGLLSGGIRIL